MTPVTQNERMARVEERLKGQSISIDRVETSLKAIDVKLDSFLLLYATKDEVKSQIASVDLSTEKKLMTARWGWGVGGAVITTVLITVLNEFVR